MRHVISRNDRIGLKALLFGYAALILWLGLTVIIDGLVKEQRSREAAAINQPSAEPMPAFVFPVR
jgi:hypothetical protein